MKRFPILLQVPQTLSAWGYSDIYLARYCQGSGPAEDRLEQLQPVADRWADDRAPTWAGPDQMAFVSDRFGSPRLFVQRPGQGPRVLLREEVLQAEFSPGGEEVAYICRDHQSDYLGIARSDGRNPQRLDLGLLPPAQLTYTPDGAGLLFSSCGRESWVRGAGPALYRLDRSSQRVTRVAEGIFEQFCISCEGNRLVFRRGHQLWLREIDSGKERCLVRAQGLPGHPIFSPDGSRLLYGLNQEQLCLMDARGGVSRVAARGMAASVPRAA